MKKVTNTPYFGFLKFQILFTLKNTETLGAAYMFLLAVLRKILDPGTFEWLHFLITNC